MNSLVRVTDAATEPVTLAEAQAFLRVDSSDDATEISTLITTARQMVEDFTGRAIISQTWKYVSDEWPDADDEDPFAIALERSPLISVESVKYYPLDGGAQATLSSANYHVITGPLPGLVVLKYLQIWPYLYPRPDAVEVNFTAGYADADSVPKPLRHAVMLMLSHLYTHRAAVSAGSMVEIPMSLKYIMESQRVGGWVE